MNVETVLGPVPIETLGRTLIHEHIFVQFAGVELDPTADYDRKELVEEAVKRLRDLKSHGVSTFVDPCPIEIGRDVTLMAEISERAEMHIVCSTGFYFEGLGIPIYWRLRSAEEIAEFYIHELQNGVGKTGIRPGLIKCSTSAPEITPLERKVLTAACIAQRATGVPILTHTQQGLCGPEQQAIFHDGHVPMHQCLIGHSCGNADPAYHRRIVERGSYIGFDRIGVTRYQPDEVRADNLVRLLRDGFGAQVMMSQDLYCAWRGKLHYQPTREQAEELDRLKRAGMWPIAQTRLFTHFLPMLRERGLTDDHIYPLLDENPRRFFAGETIPRWNMETMGFREDR